jgi:peptidoglycan/xylan/chitin deacetylase (PgdA/CDA1 family)
VFFPKLLSSLTVTAILGVALAVGAAAAQDHGPGSAGAIGPTKLTVTIDDFPENGDVPPEVTREKVVRDFIVALRDAGVSATYGLSNGNFMRWAPGEQDVLKLWLAADNPLGNHTYDHANLNEVGVQRFIENIEKQDQLLATIDTSPGSIQRRRMFRYPYLDEGKTLKDRDAVRDYLSKNGYQIAEVTDDYFDWAWNNAYYRCLGMHDSKSAAWLTSHVGDSAIRHLRAANAMSEYLFKRRVPQILLIHLNLFTALTIGDILRRWKAQGVMIMPLSEALSDPAYKINPNFAYEGGRTFLDQIGESRGLGLARFEDSKYTVERLNNVCKAAAEKTPH